MVLINQPELYSKSNAALQQETSRVLDRYCSLLKWKNNESILDVGTGDGKNTVENLMPRIPKPFLKFTGIEISEKMLDFAKEKYNDQKIEFLLFDIASKTLPSFHKNEFDHIFSFYVLTMVDDQRQGFTNIFDMLKPGGQFLVTFSVKFPWADAYETLSKNPRWAPYVHKEPVFKYYGLKNPEEEIKKDLTEIGFEIDVCLVEKKAVQYKIFEELRDFSLSVNPDILKIPLEDKEDFINEYIQAVMTNDEWIAIKDGPNNEKTYTLLYELVVILGSKPVTN